jgi:hypothetical protein
MKYNINTSVLCCIMTIDDYTAKKMEKEEKTEEELREKIEKKSILYKSIMQ